MRFGSVYVGSLVAVAFFVMRYGLPLLRAWRRARRRAVRYGDSRDDYL